MGLLKGRNSIIREPGLTAEQTHENLALLGGMEGLVRRVFQARHRNRGGKVFLCPSTVGMMS